MVFNSLTFIVFLSIVLSLYTLPLEWRAKKLILLCASYVFYAAWNPPFVLILWLTTVVDFFVARWISKAIGRKTRILLLLTSLAGNLGLLAYFKYATFFLNSFIYLLSLWNVHFQPASSSIILPVGISFYTFVTLSYTIDVYRGDIHPSKSFIDFALLVTFFPHLVAGPILRAGQFLPQLSKPKKASSKQLGWGATLISIGLVEKVILADGILAPIADKVYNASLNATTVDAWFGTFAFSGQIFCDFDGYSLCAIGIALCFGFVFPDNFRFPYAAIGFSDFWRRWHISLSYWLRDYLYISLGGNRRGEFRTYLNLALTMLIGGLWHGASWRFVIWGGLHGSYLMVERGLRTLFGKLVLFDLPIARTLMAFSTFTLVCIAWVFFRAKTLMGALHIVKRMLVYEDGLPLLSRMNIAAVFIVTGGLLVWHWTLRDSSFEELFGHLPRWCQTLALVFIIVTLVLSSGDDRAFIYFQF